MSEQTSHPSVPEMGFADAQSMGLSAEEWQLILKRLERTPNQCELGIFSAMWSEHCSYKSSRRWLKTLPTEGPQVIQGPGENAGVVDIGDGLATVFKIESHNHPSFIEPYQGAATGVGGILRDVFTMGARPVALLNALRFGAPENDKTKHLVSGVVAGIGGYGNCIGIPTVGGEVNFHASYNGNILVNAMAVGLAHSDRIFYSAATGAGNPVLSTPAGDALDDALEELEFMVSLDPWINETTRHADVILPPTSPLEHDHYDLAFHVNAMRNTARFSEAVFEKPDGAMHDWEIFQGLGQRVAQALDLEVRKAVPPHVIIDQGLKAGPYGDNSDYKLSIEALRATPSGVDLGPLKPQLPERLKTPGQRINLAPPAIFGDLARLEQQLGEASEGYRLIGRRHVRDCNSWMHNFTRLVKGPQRCTLQVSSVDAQREGWLTGSQVSVSSQAGQIVVELEITDTMMPGVVSLPHGYGHDRQGTRSEVANAHAGVSCNTITESTYIDELTGNAALNGVGVSIASL